LALGVLPVAGCSVMTAGVKKGDERSFTRSLHDVNAGRAIRARMGRAEGFKLSGVDVEIAEGIVLLSGNVPNPEDRLEAERIAWSGPKIVQVGNEIKIGGRQGIVRNTKDGALHQSVRARMIANSYVKSRNYNIEVHEGTVYLLGVARNPEELAIAAHIASTTKGTREVISYVRVTGDTSAQFATGPGFNGEPNFAGNAVLPAPDYRVPLVATPLDDDAIESGEPYYLDPQTGERVEIPPGVTPIPYVPVRSGAPIPLGRPQVINSNNLRPILTDK